MLEQAAMHRIRVEDDLNPPETTVSPSAPADTVRGSRLYGRRAECQALDRLLADVQAGESRVLIIRGEAGAGKTVLLDYLAGRSSGSGCRVVRMAGAPSEMGWRSPG
jgi:DNA-binding NtrC family response regulator